MIFEIASLSYEIEATGKVLKILNFKVLEFYFSSFQDWNESYKKALVLKSSGIPLNSSNKMKCMADSEVN